MFKWYASFRLQRMWGVRDTKMRNYLREEQKELARILMQYTWCGYGLSTSTCSKNPLSLPIRLYSLLKSQAQTNFLNCNAYQSHWCKVLTQINWTLLIMQPDCRTNQPCKIDTDIGKECSITSQRWSKRIGTTVFLRIRPPWLLTANMNAGDAWSRETISAHASWCDQPPCFLVDLAQGDLLDWASRPLAERREGTCSC
jgi:hypothetical protein